MTVTVRGIGCRAIINGTIELPDPNPAPGPTLLRWQAEAQLEGLLAAVSKGLIEGAARKLIAETFQTIRILVVEPQGGGSPCL
jgi:carbon monoxide dehydrogenase subunit G